jgi:hypothetical protein
MRSAATSGLLLTAALSFGFTGTAQAADTYNCPDFVSQADAQAVYNADPSDPNQLDRDNDAQACEEHDYVANAGTVTSAMALGSTGTVTTTSGAQVAAQPAGAIAAGDGSSSSDEGSALPYVLGGAALTAAGGAAFASRRSSRASV